MDPWAPPVVSGEGVALDLPAAGVGSRLLAAAVDLLVEGAALMVLFIIVALAAETSDSDAIGAIAVVVLVLVAVGYPLGCEWLCRGRTVGKAVLGLRVVRDDGGPVGFRQALVRSLAGLVLEKPGLLAPLSTFAGLATVVSHPRDKRIGDLLAGTVVLNERAAPLPTAQPIPVVPPALVPWVLALDLSGLDPTLAHAVRSFVSRAYAMSPAGREALAADLRARVLAVLTPAPPPGVPTAALLQAVLAERRRRTDSSLAPTAPAPAAQHPQHPQSPAAPAASGFAAPS